MVAPDGEFYREKGVTDETLLRRHKKEHPGFLAFADLDTPQQDHSLSREERMLEFELELLQQKVNEAIKMRCATYSTPDFHPTLPTIAELPSIQECRREREELIRNCAPVPSPESPAPLGEALLKEVALASEARNTREYAVVSLIRCFERRLAALPLRRYRLLFRWARHCGQSELLSRADSVLKPRLARLSEDLTQTQQALERLRRVRSALAESVPADARGQGLRTGAAPVQSALREGQKGAAGPAPAAALEEGDFKVWLNDTCYEERVRRRFGRFSRKCRWLGLHCRWELYLPVRERQIRQALGSQEDPDAPSGVPTLAASDEVISAQLDDLTVCFKLRVTGEKDPQEFAHKVDRRFAAVFSSQAAAMEFPPYELQGQKRPGADGARRGDTSRDDEEGSGEPTYLVQAVWAKHQKLRPKASAGQQRQTCRLFASAGRVDPQLKEENEFLNEHAEMQYVLKRLREQAETHGERGAVRREVHEHPDAGAELSPHGGREDRLRDARRARGRGEAEKGGASPQAGHTGGHSGEGSTASTHKRQALYLLRHIRVREFKRRLLDILNYFVSLRRRLCFDSHGYALPCDLERPGAKPRCGFSQGQSGPQPGELLAGLAETGEDGGPDSFTERVTRYSATPADFRAGEGAAPPPLNTPLNWPGPGGLGAANILQAAGIENRDDTYQIRGRSLVVRDRFDQQVMYDLALSDMGDLELELLQIGTHYMQLHEASTPPTQQDADRIALLEDLYEAETWFQDAKRKLIDAYMEAYEHVQSPVEQERLAQTVINLIAYRPALDLEEPYFTQSYTADTITLELQHSLLREIISGQITDEKRAIQSLYRHGPRPDWAAYAGLPEPPVPDTRLFQALFPGSSVVNVLDFYGSLDVVAQVPALIQSLTEAIEKRFDVPSTITLTAVRKEILQHMLVEWKILAEEERLQRQLHGSPTAEDSDSLALIEDADRVERTIAELISESQGVLSRKTEKVDTKKPDPSQTVSPTIALWCNAVEAVLGRVQLLEALYETEVLYNIHRRQGAVMGVNVRKFQFEPMDFDTRKTYPEVDELDNEDIDMAEVVALRVEYLTHLAVAEFEQSMAAFDFHSSGGVKKILSYGIPDVRRALTVQVVQKNLLIAVVLYNQVPIDHFHETCTYERAREMLEKAAFVTQEDPKQQQQPPQQPQSPAGQYARSAPPVATRFGVQAAAGLPRQPDAQLGVPRSRERLGLGAFPQWTLEGHIQRDQLQRLFVSVNHVKSVHRRCILEELNKRTAEILQSKRPELLRKRMKELKHSLISQYCISVMQAVYPYALRWQVAQLAHQLRREYHRHPGVAQAVSVTFGQGGDLLRHVATTGQQRSRGDKAREAAQPSSEHHACMIAGDGRLENAWYVPHYVQVYTQCRWDHHEAHRDDVKAGGAAGGAAGQRLHEHWHAGDATHLPTTYCLLNMYSLLHYHLSLFVLHHSMCGLAEPAAVCVERGVNQDKLGAEFARIRQELEQLSDPSDTRATVHFLEATNRMVFLRMVVALGRLKKRFLAPGESEASAPARPRASTGVGSGAKAVRAAPGQRGSGGPALPPMRVSLAVADQALGQLSGGDAQRPLQFEPLVRAQHGALALRRSDEQHKSEYRDCMRRLADFDLDTLTQGEMEAPGAGSVSPYAGLDTAFYGALTAQELGPWLGCEAVFPMRAIHGAFMLALSGEDRLAAAAEDEKRTEHYLQQEVRQDRSYVEEVNPRDAVGGPRERAPEWQVQVARACCAALEVLEKSERLMLFLCVDLPGLLDPLYVEPESLEEQFQLLKVIQKRARDRYLEELQEANDDDGSGAVQDGRRRGRRRKQSEVGLRRTLVTVLCQEINRRVLELWLRHMHDCYECLTHTAVRVMGEQAAMGDREQGSERAGEAAGPQAEKLHMFTEFHSMIMSRAVSTRQEGAEREVIFKVPEEVINQAMDLLAQRVRDWQTAHLRNIADVSEAVVQQFRLKLFNAEQRAEHLLRMRELDRKALSRRVQSRVTDEKYELRHRFQVLVKQNAELREQIARMRELARSEVKAEYDAEITALKNENRLILGQFKDHKKKLYREMQVNLEEIKRQAMMSIGKSEIAPLHMKRQALRIAISDEEMNQLKDQNNELQMTITKLKLWHDMKLMNLVGRYEKRIEKLEKQKEEEARRYWGDKAIEKEREDEMRAQVNDLQKKLSSAEMGVEQLLRDLDLQERKKKHLVQWKVAHQKEIDDLRRKAKKYEKYEKHDIDKLLTDLEREKERARLQSQDAAPGKRDRDDPALLAKDRELGRVREELRREKRLKVKAFAKLDQMREDQEAITDEMVWQRKYFECASELQRTLRDLAACKDQLQKHAVPLPASRPPSASSGRPHHPAAGPAAAELGEDGSPLPTLAGRPLSGGSSRQAAR